MSRACASFVPVAALLSLALSAAGDDRGLAIATRADLSDTGFGSSVVNVEMTNFDRAGRSARRALTLYRLERESMEVGDKTLIVFSEPADIARTALLSHSRLLEADRQWLFLPRLSRVKRISGASKTGSFVGSEFSFEDLTSQELNKYSFRWVSEEKLNGVVCDVVERRPLFKGSGYDHQRVWFERAHGQIVRVESFDRRATRRKSLELSDYRAYEGTVFRPHRMVMTNHRSGRVTRLDYGPFDFSEAPAPELFDRAHLDQL